MRKNKNKIKIFSGKLITLFALLFFSALFFAPVQDAKAYCNGYGTGLGDCCWDDFCDDATAWTTDYTQNDCWNEEGYDWGEYCIEGGDSTAPTVSAFTVPSTSSSLTISGITFTASDNVGVTGYLINESATAPAASAITSATAPTSYVAGSAGAKTLYAWVKDAAGNVSNAFAGQPCTITISDSTKPTVSTFTVPSTSSSLTISGITFTASDNVGVTGYLINESATAPAASAITSATAPTSYVAGSAGAKTLYAWVKDAAGNVSNAFAGQPCTITVSSAVNSATFTSGVKNFTGNDTPTYGNISWNAGTSGYSETNFAVAPSVIISLAVNPVSKLVYAGTNTANRYVYSYYNSTWSYLLTTGFPGTGVVYAVATDSVGNLYAASKNTGDVPSIYKYNGSWTLVSSGLAANTYTGGLAIDAAGNIYVTDTTNGKIYKLSVGDYGTWTQISSGLTEPRQIAVDSAGNVYMIQRNGALFKFAANTWTKTQIGTTSDYIGGNGIVVDASGNVYATDSAAGSVKKFTANTWTVSTITTGLLNPKTLAIDSANGDIYVGSGSATLYVRKLSSGTSVKMRVRTGTTSDGTDITDPTADGAAWSNNCEVKNNTDINTNAAGQANPCVRDTDKYVQYQAVLNTDTGTNVPTLSSVTIETEKTYKTNLAESYLISSPFNTNNPFNKLSNITWNATNNGSTAGLVGFQFRTSSNGSMWGAWCGPTNCSDTANNTTAFASDFYTTTGSIAANAGGLGYGTADANNPNKNKYFQYAAFLKANNATDTAAAIPTLNSVTVGYSFNVPPTVKKYDGSNTVPDVTQQGSGVVDVPYRIEQTIDNNTPPGISSSNVYASLFYSPDAGVELPVGGITDTQTGSVTLVNPNNAPIPFQGYMYVDSELIRFNSGSGNTINIIASGASGANGTGRGISFDDVSSGTTYKTKAAAHTAANTKVYFKATTKSGGGILDQVTTGLSATTPGTTNITQKTFNWDPRNDTNLGLSGKKLTGVNVKVVANDAADPMTAANIGESGLASGKTIDLELPTVTGVSVDLNSFTEPEKTTGIIGISKTIPVKVQFSELVTTNGDVTLKFDMGNGNSDCIVNISGSAVDNKICNLTVNVGNNADDLSLISGAAITGTIKDAVSNSTVNPASPVKKDVHDSPNLKVDGVRPTVTSVTEVSNNSNNKKAKPGEEVTLTVATSEALSASPTVTISGHNATVTGSASPYTAKYTYASSNNTDAEGEIAFEISLADAAGNPNSPAANQSNTGINGGVVVFDRTNPTLSNINVASNNSLDTAKAKTGDIVTLTFTASEALQTPTVNIARANDNMLRTASVTNVGLSYTATYTMQSGDKEENIPYTITFKDEAGNNGDTVNANSGITFDRTAPTLSQALPLIPSITNDTTPEYKFSSNEAGKISYAGGCSSVNVDAINGENTATFNALSEGTYSCVVTVKDAAGNATNLNVSSSASTASPFTIDTTGTQISITSPASGAHMKDDYVLAYTLSEDIQSGLITYAPEGGTPVTKVLGNLSAGSQSDHSDLSVDGNYTVSVTGKDLAGNDMIADSISSVIYDTVAPTLSVSAPDFFNDYADNSDVSYSVSNSGESLKDAILTFTRTGGENAPDQTCALKRAQDLTEGNHGSINLEEACENQITLASNAIYKVTFAASDLAGNSATVEITNKKFDTTAPVLQNFTTTNDQKDVSLNGDAYATGETINITANFDEDIDSSSTMDVVLENNTDPETVVELRSINGNTLSGSFMVQGPRKGFDTANVTLRRAQNQNIADKAENVQNNNELPADKTLGKVISIDTGSAILQSFTAVKKGTTEGLGSFKESGEVTISANYSKPLKNISQITVRLNTGENESEDSEDMLLSTVSSNRISGTYTVAGGDNANNLKVSSIVSQNAIDLKGNPLNTADKISLTDYDSANAALVPPVGSVANISDGMRIDTENPYSESISINSGAAETKGQEVDLALGVDDNFGTSGMTIQLSNDGNEWCSASKVEGQKSDYAASVEDWDILDSNCGGVEPDPANEKENRTVYVKYFDQAGNFKTAQDDILFDGILPRIKSITSTTPNGTYGPGSEIAVKVTYTENIIEGSQVKLIFDNTASLTLTKPAGDPSDYMEGIYTVGSVGHDSNKLKVSRIDQVVTDTAGNVQNQTNVAPTGTNLDADSSIVVDTTAPTSNISMDRSVESGKITVSFKPTDPIVADQNGMKYQVKVVSSNTSCSYEQADEASTNISDYTHTTTVQVDDIDDSVAKVCVQFMDKVGNKGSQSILSPESPQNLDFSDISNKDIGFYGSFLTWKKPADGKENVGTGGFKSYQVVVCETGKDDENCVPDPAVSGSLNVISGQDTSYTTNHFIHKGLSSSKKYCYRVRFEDDNEDLSRFSDTICSIPGESVTNSNAEVLLRNNQGDITITDITKSSAILKLKTVDGAHDNAPLPTMVNVKLYSDEALSNMVKEYSGTDVAVDHEVALTGLEANTTYYIKIVATDTASPAHSATIAYSTTVNNNLTFATLGKLAKISNISDPPAILSDTKVEINFTTDQDANCFIQYGTTPAVNQTTKEFKESVYDPVWALETAGEYIKKHSMHLTSLFPKTVYYYRIGCIDNYDANARTTVYSYSVKKDGETDVFKLDAGSEGKFQTLDRQMTEADFAGRLDGTAPSINNIALTNVTGENATITWSTNEAASSLLAYELEGTDYMLMAGDYLVNADTNKYSTTHTVQLKGLLPASKYTFTALSTDASGNIGQSTVSTFSTKEPSSLSSIKVLSKALGQATISWTTGAATSSLIEYGLTTAYGSTKEDSSKVKEHTVTLSDLTPGETYHFRVKGEDDQNNIFASSDITFQPKAPPKISDFKIDSITEHGAVVTFNTNVSTDAIVTYGNTDKADDTGFQGRPDFVSKHEIRLKDLTSGSTFSVKLKVRDEDGNETEETFPNFTTAKDEVPPKIDRVKTDAALTQNDKVQAIISWSTDELSTGEVLYKEGKSGEEKKFEVNSAPSFSHIGVITSFKSGVVYYFKVKSTDASDNTVTSTDYALLTPKQRQNIIQVIIGNFTDIFGWAKF